MVSLKLAFLSSWGHHLLDYFSSSSHPETTLQSDDEIQTKLANFLTSSSTNENREVCRLSTKYSSETHLLIAIGILLIKLNRFSIASRNTVPKINIYAISCDKILKVLNRPDCRRPL